MRSLQLAGAGSILGTYAYAIALPVYAYHSGGARTVGLVFFARFVFAALAAPWLGVLADRWSRRQLMLGGDLVRCAIFAGMTAAASAGGSPYIVYVLAVTSTVVSSSYSPAQAALLPSLVETPDELTAANLVGNTISSVGMFAGPALGGILLAFSTPAAVFALNGALFLWSAFFVVQVPRDERPARTERSQLLPELKAGFTTVWRTPALRVVITLTTGDAILYGALEVLLVVLALRILDSGNAGYGWLNTGMGVGSVVGAVLSGPAMRRFTFGQIAMGVHWIWALLLPLYALAPNPLALAAITAAAYGVTPIFFVAQYSYRLSNIPDELQGRVNGVFRLLLFGGQPLGLALAGLLSQGIGPIRTVLIFAALLTLLALAITLSRELRHTGRLVS